MKSLVPAFQQVWEKIVEVSHNNDQSRRLLWQRNPRHAGFFCSYPFWTSCNILILFHTSKIYFKRPKHCILTYTRVKVPCSTGYMDIRLMSTFWKVSGTTIFGQAPSVSLPNLGKKSRVRFLEEQTEVWITTGYLLAFFVWLPKELCINPTYLGHVVKNMSCITDIMSSYEKFQQKHCYVTEHKRFVQELHSGSEFNLAFVGRQLSANILYIEYFVITLKYILSIREGSIAHPCKQRNFTEETLTPLNFYLLKTRAHLQQDR